MDLREFFRIERRWHGVLWIIRILRSTAVPDRASAQRFSLVHREQTNGPAFSRFDLGGVLRILRAATSLGRLPGDAGRTCERNLLDSGSLHTDLLGPDSGSHAAIARQSRLCSYEFRVSRLTSKLTLTEKPASVGHEVETT